MSFFWVGIHFLTLGARKFLTCEASLFDPVSPMGTSQLTDGVCSPVGICSASSLHFLSSWHHFTKDSLNWLL